MKTLLNSKQAADFVEIAGTETGRAGMFGGIGVNNLGHHGFGPSASVHVTKAHLAMRDAVAKVDALTRDKTRSEPQKHADARTVTTAAVATIKAAATALRAEQGRLLEVAKEQTASFALAGRHPDSGTRQDIRAHIATLAKDPERGVELERLIQTEPQVAAEFLNTPHYLSPMTRERFDKLETVAQAYHVRDAAENVAASLTIRDSVDKYDRAADTLAQSTYNPVIADEAATRVEI